jgi:hypothetical protein
MHRRAALLTHYLALSLPASTRSPTHYPALSLPALKRSPTHSLPGAFSACTDAQPYSLIILRFLCMHRRAALLTILSVTLKHPACFSHTSHTLSHTFHTLFTHFSHTFTVYSEKASRCLCCYFPNHSLVYPSHCSVLF